MSLGTPAPVLVPEFLGFVPQFLLDDIVNTANDEVRQAVDAMEGFLRRWVVTRSQKVGDWDSNQDVEQGLVAFQTLLYHHLDIAFDFLEAWSMRNIFSLGRNDLPIVAPHHRRLVLDHPPEDESNLLAEIEELRRKIHAQRKLQRLYSLAVRASAAQRAHSQSRLQKLSALRPPDLPALSALPAALTAMHDAVSALPPHDHPQIAPPDPGKRPWETSKTGYLNWARDQLVASAREGEVGASSAAVGALVAGAYDVASVLDVRKALESQTTTQQSRNQRDDDEMDDTELNVFHVGHAFVATLAPPTGPLNSGFAGILVILEISKVPIRRRQAVGAASAKEKIM
ncbi:hypothetical protein EUX98_g7564 [Antrodiella citrinella]|uniref:Mis12 domain-containing protein n=1 Tax=Antrodiella citrinella TaxID=2447956 RepID=A0A4S4MN38_9APHY|nr:hypothetical protein EUX98_g7564 [Antrodiella citrinella]